MANIDNAFRLDKDKTNLALGFLEGLDPGLMKLAPVLPKPSNGQYPSYGRGAFYYKQETQRERGADPREFQIPDETWEEYICEEHTLVGRVDRVDKAKSRVQGMPYSDTNALTKTLIKALQQSLDYKIASVIFNITNLSGQYASPGTQWDLPGATPFDDLQTWHQAFVDGCGVDPTGLAISGRALSYLGEGIRVKYGATSGKSNLELIKESLIVDLGINVNEFTILKGNYYNSTSSKMVPVAGDNCLFYYNPPAMGNWQPALAATVVPNDSATTKQGVGVKVPYWNEHGTAEFVQAIREYKVLFLSKYAGYMGYDLLSGV